MEIEVINCYITKDDKNKNFLAGSAHVYVPSIGMDFRGIYFRRFDKHFFIDLPFRMGEKAGEVEGTKEECKYPLYTFIDKETHREFVKVLREEIKKYVLKEIVFPLTPPIRTKNE